MTERDYDLELEVVPVLDGIPEKHGAEPEDAEVDHHGR